MREIRARLRWTQRHLAGFAGVSQAAVWRLETGRGDDLPLGSIISVVEALGGELQPAVRPPVVLSDPQANDEIHARVVSYGSRRLVSDGWQTGTEIQVGQDRFVGWIDLIAYREADRACLVFEVKTELVDVGASLRQLRWYMREARSAARYLGWRPSTVQGVLLLLDTQRNVDITAAHAPLLRDAMPGRAAALLAWIRGAGHPVRATVALVDPRSRRAAWLRPAPSEGRRSPPRYQDLADARRRIGSSRQALRDSRGSQDGRRRA